mgnify:CR=1 FL=1
MRGKHFLSVIAMVTIMAVLIAGCGGASQSQKSGGASGGGPTQGSEGGQQAPQIVLKAGHNQVPEYPHGKIIHYFAEKVAELSNGRIKVEVFDNGTLGQEDQLFQGMMAGTIDMGKASSSVVGTAVPSFRVFDLPYLLRDREHMFSLLKGEFGEQLLKEMEEKAGVKGLIWMDQGSRSFYTVNKPIRTPDDLKGLKIRVINSEIMVDTINAMGAAATPMAFGELYTAFQQGIVDGAENAPDAVYYAKQYEVVKYFSMTHHFRTPVLFMMSMKSWEKLSQEDQEIILAAAKDAEEWGLDLYQAEMDNLLAEMQQAGMEIIEDVDLDAFRAAVQSVYDKHQDAIGVDLINKIRNYQ